MGIKDRDVRDALVTLEDEFENLEAQIKEKDEDILKLEERIEELEAGVNGLNDRIKDLEEALAEAYLTSESENEVQREDVKLPAGCRTNVSNSTSN